MDSVMSAKLEFHDSVGPLLSQDVIIHSNTSYPVAYRRHGPKLTGPSQLGCWVKAVGKPHEFKAGTMNWIVLMAQQPSGWEVMAKWLYLDLAAINCAGTPVYPGPGLGWSMNFMPILAGWCVPRHLQWLQAGGVPVPPQRAAFLRAVFCGDEQPPPTVRATKYITPRDLRTEWCPCGIHYSTCNMHPDWLQVD
jgi:hypothetical protein